VGCAPGGSAAGLPTWYTIRADRQGDIGRKKDIGLLVAMNRETAREDVVAFDAGAAAQPQKIHLSMTRAVRGGW
jgi:hypothetical protein